MTEQMYFGRYFKMKQKQTDMDLQELQKRVCVLYEVLHGCSPKWVPQTIEGCKARLAHYKNNYDLIY